MNELYNASMQNPMNRPTPYTPVTQMQKANQVMMAMWNPMQVIMQAFPDIPAAIQNDPYQIKQYLQQTRHITNEQIQNIMSQYPHY